MNWKKFMAWTIGFVLFVAIGTISTLKIFEYITINDSHEVTPNYTKGRMGAQSAINEISEEIEKGKLPSEEDFQQQIHMMSHQKIWASDKWGALEITPKRINNMLHVLDKTNYKHEQLYQLILKEWKDQDFQNAVEAHNEIWKIQGGTIGQAERLLTENEEMKFKNENFRN